MDLKKTITRTCLKVSKTRGEKTRCWLVSKGILDGKFKIGSNGQYLFFPIKNYEAVEEILPVESEIVEFSVIPRKKPVSFRDVLLRKIPGKLHDYIPSSFDRMGDIIIVKIDPILLDHKYIVGEALISSTTATAVYNKIGDVDGSFRLPVLELIAGKDIEMSIHREYSVNIVVNVKKAFFNPRLGNEHQRVAKQVSTDEIIIDFFAGVGPFALTIASAINATVYAVDINESAIDCLKESMKINKLKGKIIGIDGDIVDIVGSLPEADRIIMNLPGKAIGYLPLALGKIKKGGTIHFYGFSSKNSPDPLKETEYSVKKVFSDQQFDGKIVNSFILREVSIAKFQVAIDITKNR